MNTTSLDKLSVEQWQTTLYVIRCIIQHTKEYVDSNRTEYKTLEAYREMEGSILKAAQFFYSNIR